jgi:ABC-type transporter Mla MlaB component
VPDQVLVAPTAPGSATIGLTLVGDFDITARPCLEAALKNMRDVDADLHVDLSGVTFVDVGSLAVLAAACRTLPVGRRMYLHSPPEQVCRAIDFLWPALGGLEIVMSIGGGNERAL